MIIKTASEWFNAAVLGHTEPLPNALEAERVLFSTPQTGTVSYYTSETSTGTPLVLIHSINAGASAYEMRPIFEWFKQERPIYVPDLPGFGFSERSKRDYTPRLYTDAILALLERIGQPADVIALSLGCEFAARAALEHPEYFRSLTLIAPTGVNKPPQKSDGSDVALNILQRQIIGKPFFDALATHASIRYFLNKSFENTVDEELVEYTYKSTHQPGARHAPIYFVSGKLFTPNVQDTIYAKLTIPVLVIYDRDSFTNYEALPDLANQRENWQLARIQPTMGLPHFEKMADVADVLKSFWG